MTDDHSPVPAEPPTVAGCLVLSVVVPCFNEEDNIRETYRRLVSVLEPMGQAFEIIFVDNGSTDGSAQIFSALAQEDARVRVLFLSRNFGTSQYGYTAGAEFAQGQAVIFIDCDLQDPPELFPQFVEKWREGHEVVYGVRTERQEGVFLRWCFKMFYRVFRRLSYVDMPLDASDFGLMDRRVVEVMNAMPERGRFLRGMRAWVGFRQVGIPYQRSPRTRGRSAYGIWGYIRWAKNGIFSFSYLPLEAISFLGAACTVLAVIGGLFYLFLTFRYPDQPRGFPTLVLIVLFLGGIQLLSLSVIGEYIGRIFEEVKRRPKYIVRSALNVTRWPRQRDVLPGERPW